MIVEGLETFALVVKAVPKAKIKARIDREFFMGFMSGFELN